MKKLSLILLLIVPVMAFAQTPITPSWTRQATQISILDTIGMSYSGQIAKQYFGGTAWVRRYMINKSDTATFSATRYWVEFQPHTWYGNQIISSSGTPLGVWNPSHKTEVIIDAGYISIANGNTVGSDPGYVGALYLDSNKTSLSYTKYTGGGSSKPMSIVFDTTKMVVIDKINNRGPEAFENYHANYNALTFTDKAYVDSVASGSSSSKLNISDTTAFALKNGNSPITNKSYTALGTAGNGFFRVVSQSISPAKNASYLQVYRDSVNRFSYLNGIYRRTFAVPRSVDRTITYPYNNINPILADSSETATALGAKLNISDTAVMAYVHKAKVETITGTKTFSATNTSFANVIPTADATSNLGGASNRWSSAYILTTFTNNVRGLSGDISFIGTGGTTWGKIFNTTGNLVLQNGGTYTDNGQRLSVGGRIRVTQGLSGTAGTDSLAVHDNTSKEIKWVSAGYYLAPDAVNTATDANYTITSAGQLVKLPVITANRTVSIPTASSYTGRIIRIWNQNTSGTFSWSFTGATVKDPAGNTLTTLVNTSVYVLESDGTNYVKTN